MIFTKIIDLFEQRIIKKEKSSNQIYILPTKNGVYYIVINFLAFMIGLSYRNNIVLLISFILVSYLVMIMIKSNFSLKDLRVKNLNIESNFQNEGVTSFFDIENNSNKIISYTNFYIGKKFKKEVLNIENILGFEKKFYLGQNNQFKRGYYHGKIIKIVCHGPIKLFKTWTYKKIHYEFYIYPKPIKNNHFLNQQARDYQNKMPGENQYERHIPYHENLTPRRVDWKYYSKSDELLWRKNNDSKKPSLKFVFDQNIKDKETHLSELAGQIKWAYLNEIPWELNINDFKYGPGLKKEHFNLSLERLAVL